MIGHRTFTSIKGYKDKTSKQKPLCKVTFCAGWTDFREVIWTATPAHTSHALSLLTSLECHQTTCNPLNFIHTAHSVWSCCILNNNLNILMHFLACFPKRISAHCLISKRLFVMFFSQTASASYCVKALDQRLPVRSSGERLTRCLDFHTLDRFGGGDNLI